jgi:hypothetical protein
MKHLKLHLKIYLLFGAILTILALILGNLYSEKINSQAPVKIGVSFSDQYAKQLGLDPEKTYLSMLNDLSVKYLRLNAYWDDLEPKEGQFSFDNLDFYIEEAAKHQAKIILSIGYKLPRWPECRAPQWLEETNTSLRQQKTLVMLEKVVTRYEANPAVIAWQLENEPLLNFGVCPMVDKKFLNAEVKFLRGITKKPISLTDSGELRPWVTPMKLSDIFGTTLYRIVDVPFVGQTRYPLQPWFYQTKAAIIKRLFAPNNQKVIISELQAETWATKPLREIPIDEQIHRFPLNEFKQTLDYSKRVGFEEIYLWGVEWWYYLKLNGHPEYLEYSKTIF